MTNPEDNATRNQDISTADMTMLHRAALGGAASLVTSLLAEGADPNAYCTVDGNDKYTPLHLAAYHGHDKVVESLLAAGTSINAQTEKGWTAINLAVRGSQTAVFHILLGHGAAVNISNCSNETPLMGAAVEGNTEMAQMLLEHGADLTIKQTPGGWTALHKAVIHRRAAMVETLLAHSARSEVIQAAADAGARPLHVAASQGFPEMVEMLLSNGADPNATDIHSITPLRTAVHSGNLSVAKILISRGARTDIVATDNVSLLDVARLTENQGMIDYLTSIQDTDTEQ